MEQMFNLKFVNEVEKHPVLYNYKLKGYSKKDVTEQAWCDVGREVNLTVNECKEKWKNLRSVYVRYLKPPPSGSGVKSKKPYYLADAMEFTLPFIKTLGASASTQSHATTSTKKETDASQEMPSGTHSSPSRITNETRKTQKRPKTDVDRSYADYLQAKTRKLDNSFSQPPSNEELKRIRDYKRMFLLSLLPEIIPLTNSQMKLFRRRVLQLIDEIINPPEYVSVNLPDYQITPNSSSSSSSVQSDTDLGSEGSEKREPQDRDDDRSD